jgi:hypothetical protein
MGGPITGGAERRRTQGGSAQFLPNDLSLNSGSQADAPVAPVLAGWDYGWRSSLSSPL